MISIVMPFYKKDEEFNYAFNHYNLPMFNTFSDLELLIIVDDPHHYQKTIDNLNLLTQTKAVNFSIKVFLNNMMHDWRPPCRAINVGIRHAKFDKILIISPETIATKGAIEQLAQACTHDAYSIGLVKFVKASLSEFPSTDEMIKLNQKGPLTPYGSIMFTKQQAFKVGGYDESFMVWGGDDDDFRHRLKRAGYQQKITLAKFLHVDLDRSALNVSTKKNQELEASKMSEKIKRIQENTSFVANSGIFGNDFNQVIFDYSSDMALAA